MRIKCEKVAVLGIVAAIVLSGCNGGTVDRHALRNDAATIDSIACEGVLLAQDVRRGRSTKFFAREQAEELEIQASNMADALSKRKTLPSIEEKVREKSKKAAAVSVILRRLHDHPTDRTVGAAVARALKQQGNCP